MPPAGAASQLASDRDLGVSGGQGGRTVSGPGRLVAGRYRLLERIGGGGMGAVWLGRDELLDRQVAVKQVLPAAGVDPETTDQQRLPALREGRVPARLGHPHAISVYDGALEI